MLRPFFSYFGSKWRIAPKYPPPGHKTIVEPFAGGAGYSLRYPERDVVLVEANETIASMWDYLIKATPREIASLPLLEPMDTVDDKVWPCLEAKHLVGFWVNRGNVGPCKKHSAMVIRYWHQTSGSRWGQKARFRIANQVEAIKHWKIVHGSFEDVQNIQATWFVDPPYQQAGKHYPHGSTFIDYEQLGRWCQSRRGLTIVCENTGADWLPFTHLCDAKSMRRGRPSREAVYIQRDQ